jgi:hypothetical protein
VLKDALDYGSMKPDEFQEQYDQVTADLRTL